MKRKQKISSHLEKNLLYSEDDLDTIINTFEDVQEKKESENNAVWRQEAEVLNKEAEKMLEINNDDLFDVDLLYPEGEEDSNFHLNPSFLSKLMSGKYEQNIAQNPIINKKNEKTIEKYLIEKNERILHYIKNIEEEKKHILSLNIPHIIDSMEVHIYRTSWTHRGSDNYLCSHYTMKTEYIYMDSYLSQLFPHIEHTLYEWNEKDDIEFYSEIYPDESKWDEIAKKIEIEFKQKATDAYKTRYNKIAHVIQIASMRISFYKLHANSAAEFEQLKNETITIWGKDTVNFLLQILIERPDLFKHLLLQEISILGLEKKGTNINNY